MSMFGKPGSGSGGITPEQLDQLVSDGELSTSEAYLAAHITSRTQEGINASYSVGNGIQALLNGVAPVAGEAKRFDAARVPAGWTSVAGSFSAVPAGTRSVCNSLTSRSASLSSFAASGGYLWSTNRGLFNRFSPSSNSWDLTLTMLGLSAQTIGTGYACTLADGQVLFGGSSGATYSSAAYLFNPTTQAYTQVASSPVAFPGTNSAVLLADGRVAVFAQNTGANGNASGAVSNTNTVYIYSPSSNTWATLTLSQTLFATSAVNNNTGATCVSLLPSGKVLAWNNTVASGNAGEASTVNMATGAVVRLTPGFASPTTGNGVLVATAAGALLFSSGSTVRAYLEGTNEWAVGSAPLYANGAAMGGMSKGRAFHLTAETYITVTDTGSACAPTITFNGLPVAGVVEAIKN